MILVKGDTANYFLDQATAKRGKFGITWRAVRETGAEKESVIVKHITSPASYYTEILKRLQTINHQSFSPVIDYFVRDGKFYVVRPYIEGTDLKTIINSVSIHKKINPASFLKMGERLLDVLGTLHKSGLVHRDIKPSNIIIRHNKETNPAEWDMSDVFLIDYEQSTHYPDKSGIRAPFALVYSPPEILLKYNYLINPSSDLFSLGITIFHAITAKPPYADCNPEVLVNLQLTYPLKQPSTMSDELFAVLAKAAYKEQFPLPPRKLNSTKIEEILIKGAAARYQSAQEMKHDLQAVKEVKKCSTAWYKKILG